MYSTGRGVSLDGSAAVLWYQKAVAQKYAPAEYKLGLLYYEGKVIAQDYRRGAALVVESSGTRIGCGGK